MAGCLCEVFPAMVRSASVKNAMLSADENRPLLRTLLQRELWSALKEYAVTMKHCPVCFPTTDADDSAIGEEDPSRFLVEGSPEPAAMEEDEEAPASHTCTDTPCTRADNALASVTARPAVGPAPTTSPSASQGYNPLTCDVFALQKHREGGFRTPVAVGVCASGADTQPAPATSSGTFFSSTSPYIYSAPHCMIAREQAQPVYA